MKIFVSWSGQKSRWVASALKDWLPDLVQSVEVFMSEHDLDAGTRWSSELGSRLEACNFGVICVTPENISAPWLLFEAGCLGKSVSQSRVVPYRIGISAPDVPFPLAQFQSVSADRAGTLRLLESIVAANPTPLDKDRLNRLFERLWPDLEKRLGQASRRSESTPPQRPERELLEELVQIVRGVAQRSDDILLRMGFRSGPAVSSPYTLRIDARPLLGAGTRPFTVPYDPQQTVSDFLDMVWSELNQIGRVVAFTWGDAWMLFDEQTGNSLATIGLEYSRSGGKKRDRRTIASVGIYPQMKFQARPCEPEPPKPAHET